MKKYVLLLVVYIFIFESCKQNEKVDDNKIAIVIESNYLQNRSPLKPRPYLELPIGAIKPQGWLKDQLVRMKNGMTGHLDELYPEVVGKRNGWLGGDGDWWERSQYGIDGLLPLAYVLDDEELKAKVRPW